MARRQRHGGMAMAWRHGLAQESRGHGVSLNPGHRQDQQRTRAANMSKSSSGSRSSARTPSPIARWLPLLASSIFVVLLAVFIQHPQPDLSSNLPVLAGQAVGASSASIAAGSPLGGVRIAITGATSGIGLGLARYLHGLGATIIAIGRSPSKLQALQISLDGDDDDNTKERRVETFVADLTDLSSVARAADEIASRFDSIAYLINNAGLHYANDVILAFWKKHSTPQGFDVAFQTNYLSHFLLTEKLLPVLEKSDNDSPRIIQVSSSFHWLSDGSDLAAPAGTSPRASDGDAKSFFHRERSYANSKLAQIMHGRSLSRKLRQIDSKVRVVSICPGWVATNVTGSSGFNKMLLQTIAYPNDGFGLASTLNAMFLPNVGADEKEDYFVNSVAFDMLGMTIEKMGLEGKQWPAATGFRDALSWTFAVTLLWTQRFASGAQLSTSSPESYQQSIQDELYAWSKSAVSEWL